MEYANTRAPFLLSSRQNRIQPQVETKRKFIRNVPFFLLLFIFPTVIMNMGNKMEEKVYAEK